MSASRPPDHIAFEAQLAVEAQLTTALHLAAEALTAAKETASAAFAAPEGDHSVPRIEEYDWLRDLAAHIRQTLAQDPRRAELLRSLPQGLGDGEILHILFGNLFPQQRHQRKETRDGSGRKRLTETQTEVLRGYARGKSVEQIAIQRGCSVTNVHKILKSIQGRLHTHTSQESVAVAISMGYLPLNVMDFVRETAQCEPRDYSLLDWHISAHTLENVADAPVWQELGAFGLFLMLASNMVSSPLKHAGIVPLPTGVLWRLEPEGNGAYRARPVVGPGRLRFPTGLAIAPPAAEHQGFTPGAIYVVNDLAARQGLNLQEIVEFRPDGTERRAFCGGRTLSSALSGARDLRFDTTGALLVTGGNALLRFTEGGACVRPLILHCCSSVCEAPKGHLTLAHHSTRGASIGVYTRNGKLRRLFGQQPVETYLRCVQPLPGGELAALRCAQAKPDESTMQIYDAADEFSRSWRVPGASDGSFAFDARERRFFVPCRAPGDIAVYGVDGHLQGRIPFGQGIAPYAVALDKDGALWGVGSLAAA